MKGADPLIISVILIVVAITAATIISTWSTTLYSGQADELRNQSVSASSCKFASFYVSNVSVSCNNNCFTGYPYQLNASIENTGIQSLYFSGVFVTLTNGTSYVLSTDETLIDSGLRYTKEFNSILVSGSPRIPIETMDLRSAYTNHTNTVGLWHFDDAGNETVDVALNNTGRVYAGLKGILTNSPTWNTSGYYGNALSFDGIDDYVSLGNPIALNITGNIWISAWIYPHDITTNLQNMVAHGHTTSPNGEIIFRINGGKYEIGSWDGSTQIASYVIPSGDKGTWVYLSGGYNGTHWLIYRNGVLVNSTEDSTGAVVVEEDWAIGAMGTGTSRFYTGSIDEVAIWNRSLTGDEVNQTKNTATPNSLSFENDMVSYWSFNKGSGTEAPSEHFWTPGKFGGAMKFNASEYVNNSYSSNFNITDNITVEMWVYIP
jgi:hypothetical protein